MIKGVTKSGFLYKFSKERLNNYELLEELGELEESPMALSKVVNLLLGKEQAKKLKEHVRGKDGLVSTEKISAEIKEIFENQNETKN
ncbi:hypothetical protein P7H60_06260 [Vagococcus carniphilus]|uniref:hypothetical protein n=1 Tax=Vagococcus carniphilus TaxID=218144 RepID=UPI0028906117|nr:hypothetical protein [Vagococcus carniphilus]MDT2848760.1 hypothetical protein [Vagococcus carniphilus]